MGYLLLLLTSHLVFCVDRTTAQGADGEVRFVDVASSSRGRVEVFHDGVWGRICDDGVQEAPATCTQHGFSESGIEVRLVEGSTRREGRVEVWYNGEWGTVCRRGYGHNEASVFCRQAGLGAYGSVIDNTQTPGGEGQIWLADVKCRGTEESIAECRHAAWGATYCTHSSDVEICCRGKTMGLAANLVVTALALITSVINWL